MSVCEKCNCRTAVDGYVANVEIRLLEFARHILDMAQHLVDSNSELARLERQLAMLAREAEHAAVETEKMQAVAEAEIARLTRERDEARELAVRQ